MKKMYSYLLFFTFFFAFSSLATEEVSEPIITVKTKVSQMSDVLEILKEIDSIISFGSL
jgi:hypothetical protein